MPAALISRHNTVALKTEGTAGTAETLADADGAINCYDAAYTPEINMSERTSQGTYDANLKSIPGARMGRISFRTDYHEGQSSQDLWYSRTLLHAGFTLSSGTATAVGSASTSTATVGMYVDGLRHLLVGAVVSSMQIDFEAGEPMYVAVEYMGKYAAPTDTALITPTYPTTTPSRFASGNLTLGGTAIPTFSGSVRVENTVAMRPDPTDPTGYLHAQITRQTITASLNVEAALEATRSDYGQLISTNAASLVLTDSTSSAVFTLPNAQRVNLQPGDTDGIYSRTLDFLHTGSTAATIVMS